MLIWFKLIIGVCKFCEVIMEKKFLSYLISGMYGCGIFIDLHYAFYTVNHSILLRRLELSVRYIDLQWSKSYLNNRKQYVYINVTWCTTGISVRTSFSDLDLPNILEVFQFFLFADDANIYYEAESPDKLKQVTRHVS